MRLDGKVALAGPNSVAEELTPASNVDEISRRQRAILPGCFAPRGSHQNPRGIIPGPIRLSPRDAGL